MSRHLIYINGRNRQNVQKLEEHGSVALRTWGLPLENLVAGDSRGRKGTGTTVICIARTPVPKFHGTTVVGIR